MRIEQHHNEPLIREVFEAVLVYRPALQKTLAFDEDEEEGPDIRELGDAIIKSYPWPIGVEIRRLLSASCRSLNRHRLDQLLKTAERSCQFVSFVLLAQVFDQAQKNKPTLPESLKSQLRKRIEQVTFGNLAWLLRELPKAMEACGIDPFVEGLDAALDKQLLSKVDALTTWRNEIAHYQVNLPAEEIEKKCLEVQEALIHILRGFACLTAYRLLAISQIQVIKLRSEEPKFLHVINLLNSSDSDFKGRSVEETEFTDSHAVVLTKSIKSLRDFLNLSPLVIDTHSEVIDSREKFNLKKDIFLYSKYRDGQLFFVGTETTEKCDLRPLTNYKALVSEYELMLELLTS